MQNFMPVMNKVAKGISMFYRIVPKKVHQFFVLYACIYLVNWILGLLLSYWEMESKTWDLPVSGSLSAILHILFVVLCISGVRRNIIDTWKKAAILSWLAGVIPIPLILKNTIEIIGNQGLERKVVLEGNELQWIQIMVLFSVIVFTSIFLKKSRLFIAAIFFLVVLFAVNGIRYIPLQIPVSSGSVLEITYYQLLFSIYIVGGYLSTGILIKKENMMN